jgi:hypothetical protein
MMPWGPDPPAGGPRVGGGAARSRPVASRRRRRSSLQRACPPASSSRRRCSRLCQKSAPSRARVGRGEQAAEAGPGDGFNPMRSPFAGIPAAPRGRSRRSRQTALSEICSVAARVGQGEGRRQAKGPETGSGPDEEPFAEHASRSPAPARAQQNAFRTEPKACEHDALVDLARPLHAVHDRVAARRVERDQVRRGSRGVAHDPRRPRRARTGLRLVHQRRADALPLHAGVHRELLEDDDVVAPTPRGFGGRVGPEPSLSSSATRHDPRQAAVTSSPGPPRCSWSIAASRAYARQQRGDRRDGFVGTEEAGPTRPTSRAALPPPQATSSTALVREDDPPPERGCATRRTPPRRSTTPRTPTAAGAFPPRPSTRAARRRGGLRPATVRSASPTSPTDASWRHARRGTSRRRSPAPSPRRAGGTPTRRDPLS